MSEIKEVQMTEGDIPNQKRLSYKEFLEICWGDYKPQDASLYQLLFRRLCARGFLEPDGEIPYPVEYKYGPLKSGKHADLQLCGQALCLEEMTGQPVLRGAIFYFSSRRRREVRFDSVLRERAYSTIEAIRHMLREPELPPPVNDKRCVNCSLTDSCLPAAVRRKPRIRSFQKALFVVERPPLDND